MKPLFVKIPPSSSLHLCPTNLSCLCLAFDSPISAFAPHCNVCSKLRFFLTVPSAQMSLGPRYNDCMCPYSLISLRDCSPALTLSNA